MDLDRWRAVERVLDRALASDPSSWPALLADSCAGNPELRMEVEALLAQRSAAQDFLASPPTVAVSALVAEEQGRVSDDESSFRAEPPRHLLSFRAEPRSGGGDESQSSR